MKHLIKTAKSFAVAFSIYSVIPMPRFTWGSEDMDYHLIFFPWVGGVIGLLEYLWMWITQKAGLPTAAYAAIATVIPLLVTGGFHMDGYLDTMDAVHSYKSREEKLQIMSDPHIGAFAVVWAGIWFLLFLAGSAMLKPGSIFAVFCMSFFLSRTLSGLGVVFIPSAKTEGMLQTFSSTAHRDRVRIALGVELCVCGVLMGAAGGVAGLAMMAAAGCCYAAYRYLSLKNYQGITGDLAGCFVCVTELVLCLLAGILCQLVR